MSELIASLVENDVARALAEDIGSGDLTAQLIPATQTARARVVTRDTAVIAGRPWFDACFRALDPNCVIDWRVGARKQASNHGRKSSGTHSRHVADGAVEQVWRAGADHRQQI